MYGQNSHLTKHKCKLFKMHKSEIKLNIWLCLRSVTQVSSKDSMSRISQDLENQSNKEQLRNFKRKAVQSDSRKNCGQPIRLELVDFDNSCHSWHHAPSNHPLAVSWRSTSSCCINNSHIGYRLPNYSTFRADDNYLSSVRMPSD